jgi:hypothetical protein
MPRRSKKYETGNFKLPVWLKCGLTIEDVPAFGL